MHKTVAHTIEEKVYYCDICNKELSGTTNYKCCICKRDVCYKCSIFTDFFNLAPGEFQGDRPDTFCKLCWNKGKDIITKLKTIRDDADKQEQLLWKDWFYICPALIPIVVSESNIPISSSLPTLLGLIAIIVAYQTLKLRLAALATLLTAVMWGIILIKSII